MLWGTCSNLSKEGGVHSKEGREEGGLKGQTLQGSAMFTFNHHLAAVVDINQVWSFLDYHTCH